MRPSSRRMSQNDSSRVPISCMVFDCESNKRWIDEAKGTYALTFRLACTIAWEQRQGKITRRVEKRHLTIKSVYEHIRERQQAKQPLWVFAHNLEFDLGQIDFYGALDDGEFTLRGPDVESRKTPGKMVQGFRGTIVTNGPPAYAIVLGRKGTVKFVDTMNYVPKGLEKIGQTLGTPKVPFPGFDADQETTFQYCLNDCLILEELMLSLFAKWQADDCGVWQLTAPMLALTSFRHLLPVPHKEHSPGELYLSDKPDWDAFERRAYFGGQTTCFYVGPVVSEETDQQAAARPLHALGDEPPVGPLFLVDVNSLYPAMMDAYPFPSRRGNLLTEPTPGHLLDLMTCWGCVASVRIDSPTDEYIVRGDDEQWHCCGGFDTVLCGPELLRALKAGHVRHVYRAQMYSLDFLFRNWVNKWYARRLASKRRADSMDDAYCKLLLNSLSGKFAQRSGGWVMAPGLLTAERWGRFLLPGEEPGTVIECRGVAGEVQRRGEDTIPWFSFPAISAYITSYGREFMRRVRLALPARSCLYQATDALIVTRAGFAALDASGMIQDDALGYFKKETWAEDGEIVGHNHYRLGEQWVRSGAYGRSVRQADGSYRYERWTSGDERIDQGPGFSTVVTSHEVTGRGLFTKGSLTPGGWMQWPKMDDSKGRF